MRITGPSAWLRVIGRPSVHRLPGRNILAGVVLCAVLGLPGCGAGATDRTRVGDVALDSAGAGARASVLSDDAVPRPGGTAVVGVPYEPRWLSPLWMGGAVDARILAQTALYTPLFRPDARLEPTPVLVESWDTTRVAPDSLALTLRLRQDVFWHDGMPTTAHDVAFAYRIIRDPAAALAQASYFQYFHPDVEVVGDHELRFVLRAHAHFLSNLVLLLPAPRHLLADLTPERAMSHPIGQRPVGNGPFRFVRYVPGQEWIFERNPDHPAALGGPPYLERLVLRTIPEPSTRLTELLTGGIDVMTGAAAWEANAIEASPGVRLVTAPSSHFGFIAWNTRRPMFADARVRRALTLALDRQAIVDVVRFARETAGRSTVRPIDWMWDSEAAVPYDPVQAGELLGAAGWIDRNGDGFRENSAGEPLRFTVIAPLGFDHGDVLTMMQAQLRAVGADLRPQLLEASTLLATTAGTLNAGGARARDFDAVLNGFYWLGPKDDAPLLHSRAFNEPLGVSGFGHARADQLLDSLALMMDRSQTLPLWREYEQIIAREAPLTVISYRQYFVGVRDGVHGVEVNAAGELASVARWWLSGERSRR